ncbi:DUF302 domain-containing protein [Halobacteriaceae archaeon GCM10025711]
MSYTIQETVDGEFDAVVDRVTDALGEEGFGILSDIDMQATLKAKLDREFRNYTILGACNPPLASDALDVDIDVGALLPCNVVVYEADDGSVVVSAVDPKTLLDVADDPDLEPIGEEVRERLERALSTL